MEVRNLSKLQSLQKQVHEATRATRTSLATLDANPLEALHTLRFEKVGYHPLEERRLNLVEQLNQTFTIMASLAAARHLLKWFPQSGGLRLNLGTAQGRDIESVNPKVVEAEVFAAVRRSSNSKLSKEIQKLAKSDAASRYVFFYVPSHPTGRRLDLEPPDSNVKVWALSFHEVMQPDDRRHPAQIQ